MRQFAVVKNTGSNELFAIIVKDEDFIVCHGVHAAGKKWAEDYNQGLTKSIHDGLHPEISVGQFAPVTSTTQSLIDEATEGKSVRFPDYSQLVYVESVNYFHRKEIPQVKDAGLSNLRDQDYFKAVDYKGAAFRADAARLSVLAKSRLGRFGVDAQGFNFTEQGADQKALNEELFQTGAGYGSVRRAAKEVLLEKGLNRDAHPGFYHRNETQVSFHTSIQTKRNRLGRRIGGGGSGGIRKIGRSMRDPFDPNAWDGDSDGLVQEGTAWERPSIPGVNTNLPGMPKTRTKPRHYPGDNPARVRNPSARRQARRSVDRDRSEGMRAQFPGMESERYDIAHDSRDGKWHVVDTGNRNMRTGESFDSREDALAAAVAMDRGNFRRSEGMRSQLPGMESERYDISRDEEGSWHVIDTGNGNMRTGETFDNREDALAAAVGMDRGTYRRGSNYRSPDGMRSQTGSIESSTGRSGPKLKPRPPEREWGKDHNLVPDRFHQNGHWVQNAEGNVLFERYDKETRRELDQLLKRRLWLRRQRKNDDVKRELGEIDQRIESIASVKMRKRLDEGMRSRRDDLPELPDDRNREMFDVEADRLANPNRYDLPELPDETNRLADPDDDPPVYVRQLAITPDGESHTVDVIDPEWLKRHPEGVDAYNEAQRSKNSVIDDINLPDLPDLLAEQHNPKRFSPEQLEAGKAWFDEVQSRRTERSSRPLSEIRERQSRGEGANRRFWRKKKDSQERKKRFYRPDFKEDEREPVTTRKSRNGRKDRTFWDKPIDDRVEEILDEDRLYDTLDGYKIDKDSLVRQGKDNRYKLLADDEQKVQDIFEKYLLREGKNRDQVRDANRPLDEDERNEFLDLIEKSDNAVKHSEGKIDRLEEELTQLEGDLEYFRSNMTEENDLNERIDSMNPLAAHRKKNDNGELSNAWLQRNAATQMESDEMTPMGPSKLERRLEVEKRELDWLDGQVRSSENNIDFHARELAIMENKQDILEAIFDRKESGEKILGVDRAQIIDPNEELEDLRFGMRLNEFKGFLAKTNNGIGMRSTRSDGDDESNIMGGALQANVTGERDDAKVQKLNSKLANLRDNQIRPLWDEMREAEANGEMKKSRALRAEIEKLQGQEVALRQELGEAMGFRRRQPASAPTQTERKPTTGGSIWDRTSSGMRSQRDDGSMRAFRRMWPTDEDDTHTVSGSSWQGELPPPLEGEELREALRQEFPGISDRDLEKEVAEYNRINRTETEGMRSRRDSADVNDMRGNSRNKGWQMPERNARGKRLDDEFGGISDQRMLDEWAAIEGLDPDDRGDRQLINDHWGSKRNMEARYAKIQEEMDLRYDEDEALVNARPSAQDMMGMTVDELLNWTDGNGNKLPEEFLDDLNDLDGDSSLTLSELETELDDIELFSSGGSDITGTPRTDSQLAIEGMRSTRSTGRARPGGRRNFERSEIDMDAILEAEEGKLFSTPEGQGFRRDQYRTPVGQRARSRMRDASTDRASQTQGMRSRKQKGTAARVGLDRFSEDDGQIWENLTDAERQRVADSATELLDAIMHSLAWNDLEEGASPPKGKKRADMTPWEKALADGLSRNSDLTGDYDDPETGQTVVRGEGLARAWFNVNHRSRMSEDEAKEYIFSDDDIMNLEAEIEFQLRQDKKAGRPPIWGEKKVDEFLDRLRDLQILRNMRDSKEKDGVDAFRFLEQLTPSRRESLYKRSNGPDKDGVKGSMSSWGLAKGNRKPSTAGIPLEERQSNIAAQSGTRRRVGEFSRSMAERIWTRNEDNAARRALRRARRGGAQAGIPGFRRDEQERSAIARRIAATKRKFRTIKGRKGIQGAIDASEKKQVNKAVGFDADGKLLIGEDGVARLGLAADRLLGNKESFKEIKMKGRGGKGVDQAADGDEAAQLLNQNLEMAVIWDAQGMNELPVLVNQDGLNDLIDSGGYVVGRGHGSRGNATDYLDDELRFLPGTGGEAYGKGEYWSNQSGSFESWQKLEGGNTVGVLTPNVRRITTEDLEVEASSSRKIANAFELVRTGYTDELELRKAFESNPAEIVALMDAEIAKIADLADGKPIWETQAGQLWAHLLDSIRTNGDMDSLMSILLLEKLNRTHGGKNLLAPILGYDTIKTGGVELIMNRSALVALDQTVGYRPLDDAFKRAREVASERGRK